MSYKKISTSNTVMRLINAENLVYADKTPFIARLEEDPACKVAVFLRPRRFGKTLFTDMLMSYYDRSLAGSFDSTFKGTWIHEHKDYKTSFRFQITNPLSVPSPLQSGSIVYVWPS